MRVNHFHMIRNTWGSNVINCRSFNMIHNLCSALNTYSPPNIWGDNSLYSLQSRPHHRHATYLNMKMFGFS